MADETLRLDKFLWFVRLARNRATAQAIAEAGHVRLNGRRVDQAHCPVRIGDVLSVPLPRGVAVLRVEGLPVRRVSAKAIPDLYTRLDTKS